MNNKNEQVKEYLLDIINELNNKYPNIISKEKQEKALTMFIDSDKNIEEIKNEINIKKEQIISGYLRELEKEKEIHYDLNDYFDCRISHNSLHIHVIPKDIKEDFFRMKLDYYSYVEEKLIDALNKIPNILSKEED